MKKIIFIITIAIAAVCSFTGCEKDNAINTQQNIMQTKTDPYGVTIFSIQLHRKIVERPRDHKRCDCFECFGLCRAEVFPDIQGAVDLLHQVPYPITDQHHSLVALQILDVNNAKLIFLENKEAFEDEFGVGSPIQVPSECLKQLGDSLYNSIEIKKGIYTFQDTISSISLYGKTIRTYGYVNLKIDCK